MAKQRPLGKCKLCGLVKDLCDSHYLPKRLYAFANAKELSNRNPVMSINGVLKQICDQYRGYVFCKQCETVLNRNGENWVLKRIPRDYDGPFPLRDKLRPLTPTFIGDGLHVYNVLGVREFNIEKLVFFGMSIFWRGAVHRWKSTAGQEAPEVDLQAYEGPMREFVLGKGPFPMDVVLTVDIWPYKKVLQAFYPALAAHSPEYQKYWFYVPGLLFALYAGANIPRELRALNAAGGIVMLDVKTADSVLNYTTEGIKSQHMGPKMTDLLNEIAAIRSKASTNNDPEKFPVGHCAVHTNSAEPAEAGPYLRQRLVGFAANVDGEIRFFRDGVGR